MNKLSVVAFNLMNLKDSFELDNQVADDMYRGCELKQEELEIDTFEILLAYER